MRFLPIMIVALLIAGCTQQSNASIPSKEVSFNSNGWIIYGTLYASANGAPAKAILLLPGLGNNRDAFPPDFIQNLHENVPDAEILALDLRGQGKSTNLGDWHQFSTADFSDMKTDVLSADDYLSNSTPTVKEFYLVGASVGSTAAITAAAEDNRVTRVAMLSPGIGFNGVSIQDSAQKYQSKLLLVASSGDEYSAKTAAFLAYQYGRSGLSMMLYDGTAHGTGLFDATQNSTPTVSDLVVGFLKN